MGEGAAGKTVLWGPAWSSRVCRAVAHTAWKTRAWNSELVPAEGPVILACNHVSGLDGIILAGASPRPAHFIVKKEAYREAYGLVGKLLHYGGMIPVDRKRGRGALKQAAQVLENGRVVAIFPEGTRGSGRVSQVRAGVAWLAKHTGAPIVPAALLGLHLPGEAYGTKTPWRRQLHAVFGEPLKLENLEYERSGVRAQDNENQLRALAEVLAQHVDYATELTGVPTPQ